MKRGQSGLSLVVGIDKPQGLSSHDVVNSVRRAFGERRVGHTGTLDPLATGVLPVCVGPATRLDKYMTDHDKRYRATMCFGFETTTDDGEGQPTAMGSVPDVFNDPSYAKSCVEGLVGIHEQTPPQYSAIKVNGKKAYEVARSGGEVDIPTRTIEIRSAEFIQVGTHPEAGLTTWEFEVEVSKGTYIRSLVRDLGRNLDCPAHLLALRRLKSGNVDIRECVSLEVLGNLGQKAAIDPVRVLGFRYSFLDEYERFVNAGTKLYSDQVVLNEPLDFAFEDQLCSCTSGVMLSSDDPIDGELVSIVISNRLKALYRYKAEDATYRPECVFPTAITRF